MANNIATNSTKEMPRSMEVYYYRWYDMQLTCTVVPEGYLPDGSMHGCGICHLFCRLNKGS